MKLEERTKKIWIWVDLGIALLWCFNAAFQARSLSLGTCLTIALFAFLAATMGASVGLKLHALSADEVIRLQDGVIGEQQRFIDELIADNRKLIKSVRDLGLAGESDEGSVSGSN